MNSIVVLYSEDPRFFERPDVSFNRRGVDVFCAMDLDELTELMHTVSARMVVAQGAPGGLPEPALRAHLGASPHVVVLAQPDDDPITLTSYQHAPGSTVLLEPYADKLQEVSAKVLPVAPRYFVRILVQVKDAGDGTATFAYCQNVSATGMLVELKRPLQVGTTLRMSFLVPGTQGMVDVHARVVRHACTLKDVHRYGLQFLDISDHGRSRIETLASGAGKYGAPVARAA